MTYVLVSCPPGLCANNGTCDGGECSCTALTYWGPRCQYPHAPPAEPYTVPTTPCTGNPCMNNGICLVVNGAAQCLCEEPYEGQYCEIGKA